MNKDNESMQDNEKERLREQLKQQEKLASLGMLSAGIAHEIRNPLNFIINFGKVSKNLIQELQGMVEKSFADRSDEEREEFEDIISSLSGNLQKITEHGKRALNIVQGILLESRGKEDGFVPTDAVQLTQEYVRLSYHAMRANYKDFNISIQEQYEKGIPAVNMVPQDFSRVVLNVMNNACYAVWKKAQLYPEGYNPTVRIALFCKNGFLVLEIEDNGEGMDEETKRKIYEAFYTTKPTGHGTGLGMSIVKELVEQKHHGHISFQSETGQYTCFTIYIPLNL